MITDKIDNIVRIPEAYRNPICPAPRSVKIELTGRCNFRCAFCARSQKLRKQGDMDMSTFQRLAKEMHAAGVEELGLFYLGEPMMDPRIENAIAMAKNIGFSYTFLTTNGSLATPDKVRGCIEAGLDSLKFSINYADEGQFMDIAKVKPALFQKMVENIKGARKVRDEVEAFTGHHCGLYGSYITYDGDQGARMQQLVDELTPYLDQIYALPLYGQAGPQDSPMRDGKLVPTGGNTGRADNPVPSLPCWAVFTEGHITHDAKLSACCWDHNDGLTMGDLNTTPFMEAWNSERFQALRKAHLSGDVHGTICQACIYPGAA